MMDMTLTFDGVEGNAAIELAAPIQVLAWSWGVQSGPQVAAHDLSITKYIGLDTPRLMALIASGAKIRNVTLRSVGKSSDVSLVLKNAKITSLSTGGCGGEERLTENISICFEEMDYVYTKLEDSKKIAESSDTLKIS